MSTLYYETQRGSTLCHHGIKGQKWGVQNGPPYPLQENKNNATMNMNYDRFSTIRLSKKEWLFGSILNLKPLITITNGAVKVATKKIGLKMAMRECADTLKKWNCDESYPIIASYTYNSDNLTKLIEMTDECYKLLMSEYDNLCPVIACHWGPNAFGYVFVSKQ